LIVSFQSNKKADRVPEGARSAVFSEHGLLHGRTAWTGTPSGIQRHHQDHFSDLFIFLQFSVKKTDHASSGMIRIRFHYFLSSRTQTPKRKRGPLQPALPTPGKGDVSDVVHKTSSFLINFF